MKALIFLTMLMMHSFSQSGDEGGSLKATITGLKTAEGKVAILLCDENGTEVGQYWLFVESLEVVLDVPDLENGQYAIKFFHDINNNGKMDQNILGIPTEDFGFSNDAKIYFGMPALEKMLFEVAGQTEIQMKAKRF